MKSALAICLLVALSIGEGECRRRFSRGRSNSFTEEDLGEIAGLAGYMIARFANGVSSHEARKIRDDSRESSYVSSAYNLFTGERVLTNAMVKEAVGDVCFYNSKLRGDTRDTAKDKEQACEENPYAGYDWEKAIFQGNFSPSKELIEAAAGDLCYLSAKYILGYSQQRSEDLYEECKSSHYVDYVYDAFAEQRFLPESKMISEAFGDICYASCRLGRQACLNREKRCEKTQYVDLLYNLFQGKNRFTNEVLDKMAYDICYWGKKLVKGGSERSARALGGTCKKHAISKMIKPIIKIVLEDILKWPLHEEEEEYYDEEW